jgi:hypothetical protein
MATTTPNNGWPVPTSTDYVKDGATAIEALGDAIDTSVGEGLLAWQSWAPTLSGGWANGNGTWEAYYAQIGKTVFVQASFIIGSTTTKGSGLVCSLPVTAARARFQSFFSMSSSYTAGVLQGYIDTTSTFTLVALSASATYVTRAQITSTVPATWGTGNSIQVAFSYEAA